MMGQRPIARLSTGILWVGVRGNFHQRSNVARTVGRAGPEEAPVMYRHRVGLAPEDLMSP